MNSSHYYLMREQVKTISEKNTSSSSSSQSLETPIGTESAGSSSNYDRPVTPPHQIVRNTYDQEISIEVNSSNDDRPVTPPHQIVRNTYDQEISINENILIMSAKNLASLDESKVFD